jgi:hypothetical protein
MEALIIYTSKCNNLNILRYDVLFILVRLINVLFIFITQLLVGPPVPHWHHEPLKFIKIWAGGELKFMAVYSKTATSRKVVCSFSDDILIGRVGVYFKANC